MKKFLLERLELVAVVLGIIGSKALDRFIAFEDYDSYFVVAPIFTLLVSLIVSFFLKTRITKPIKQRIGIWSLVFLLLTSGAFYLYFSMHTDYGVAFPQPDGSNKVYLMGRTETDETIALRKIQSFTDKELIEANEGTENMNKIWTQKSINTNKKIIFIEYFFFVLFASGLLYTTLEMLTKGMKKDTAP